jgi:hypothetical protein
MQRELTTKNQHALFPKRGQDGCRTEKSESGSALMFPNASISGVGSGVSWFWKSALGAAVWYMINTGELPRIKRFALCCVLVWKDAYHQDGFEDRGSHRTPFAPTPEYHR